MTDPRTPGIDELADAAAAEVRSSDGTDAPAIADDNDSPGEPVAALASELAAQNDKYLRLYAEFENFKRRAVQQRQESEHRGMGSVMRGLLEALDDLARVAHVDPAGTDAQTVVDGVALVEKKLLKSLAGHGLELVDPAGAAFDPALHEAITTTPAASADEDHTVAQVFQVGYVLNGTLLRPARVVVKQWNG